MMMEIKILSMAVHQRAKLGHIGLVLMSRVNAQQVVGMAIDLVLKFVMMGNSKAVQQIAHQLSKAGNVHLKTQEMCVKQSAGMVY